MLLDKYNLSINDYLIIGVSGGPDSMFLLSSLVKVGYKNIIVAHINYHHRSTANRDEDIVRRYCKLHDLVFYKKDYKDTKAGNFQNNARIYRYEFFKKLYKKYDARALLTAHHKDDLIETYQFKKQRNSIGDSLIINEEDYIYSMRVIRPLVTIYYKDEILKLVDTEYGIDESNLTDDYTRNRIRHKNELLSLDVKNNVFLEAIKENEKLQKLRSKAIDFDIKEFVDLDKFNAKTKEEKVIIMFAFIKQNIELLAPTLTKKFIEDLILKVEEKSSKKYIKIKDDYHLYIEDNKLKIVRFLPDFSYLLESYKSIKVGTYKVSKKGCLGNGIHVDENDYPLTIRSYKNDDVVYIKNGSKTLNRYFIGKKVPLHLRNQIPVVINNKNEILLIPYLYRNINRSHLKNNFFLYNR